jgi:hypothetical protein
MQTALQQYLDNSEPYFINPDYKDDTLTSLIKALSVFENWIAATVVQAKRSLLQLQAGLVREEMLSESFEDSMVQTA